MTPEAQRITIAEACGYGTITIVGGKPCGEAEGQEGVYYSVEIPDYLNDLNAMHEMEKVLTISQREDYVTLLNENFTTASPNTVWWTNAHATAAQRAEAFLKTLGLWK